MTHQALIANANGSTAAANGDTTVRVWHPRFYVKLTEESGLSPETIERAGLYVESDREKIARLLNREQPAPKSWGPCLIYPYMDEAGEAAFCRVKPLNPPVDQKSQRPRKYLQPSHRRVRPYILPHVAKIAKEDPAARLFVTEGEDKTLCLCQHGFHAIGLSGVDCWAKKGTTDLLPEIKILGWAGRRVLIAFDSDAETNPRVEQNARLLAQALQGEGAIVGLVRIPSGPTGQKQGADDFIVANGPGAFEQLAAKAQQPPPPDAGEDGEKVLYPPREAAAILEAMERDGISRFRTWRGSHWYWSRGRYDELSREVVRGKIANHLAEDFPKVGTRGVSDVLEHLKGQSMLPDRTEPPAWLPADTPPPEGYDTRDLLVTSREIIHLPSLVEGKPGWCVPATPQLFALSALPFAFPEDAESVSCPAWIDFLNSVWPNDKEAIQTLQEIFGYCLTPDTSHQKMFMIVGPPRSGKGTIGRTLTHLVGKQNVTAPTLASLADRFGLEDLVGKTVATIADARLSGRTDQTAVVERLLSISGEDTQTIDRKFRPAVTMRLPVRFVILTNEWPRLCDASGALVSRIVALEMTESFLGRENHALGSQIEKELPGVLAWAIEGWRRLRQRGRFLQADSAADALDLMRNLASPVAQFVHDLCEVGPNRSVEVRVIYGYWAKWSRSQGRDKFIGDVQHFTRDLRSAFPGIRSRRPSKGGERVRVLEGIGMDPEATAQHFGGSWTA